MRAAVTTSRVVGYMNSKRSQTMNLEERQYQERICITLTILLALWGAVLGVWYSVQELM